MSTLDGPCRPQDGVGSARRWHRLGRWEGDVRLVHAHRNDEAGGGSEGGDTPDSGSQSEPVGEEAGAGEGEPGAGEEDGEEAPGRSVVELVAQAGMAGRR